MEKSVAFLAEHTTVGITVLALVLVFGEWIILAAGKKIERHREGWVSLLSAALAFLPIFALSKLVLVGVMFWLYQYRLFDPGLAWYAWVFAWIVYEFLFWFLHWIGHNIRIFWCFHNVHHSAKEMKLSVAFRGSVFDVLYMPHNILWLPLLGFHPFMLLIVDALGKLYGILVHVHESSVREGRSRWLEWFLISPSIHRVHHSSNHLYLDRNFGQTLSIWDRLFGTYQEELATEKPVYGVLKDIDSENLLDTQLAELKSLWNDIQSTDRMVDKVRYVFMPPGWNPQSEGTTAEDLRKAAWQQHL